MATTTSDQDRDASPRMTCRVTRVSDSPQGDMVYRVDVLRGCGGQVVHCDHIVYPAGSHGYRVDDGERVVGAYMDGKRMWGDDYECGPRTFRGTTFGCA